MNNKKKLAWVGTVSAILGLIWLIARLTGFNVFDVAKVSELKEDVAEIKVKVMTTPPLDERVNCVESDIRDIKEDIGEIKTGQAKTQTDIGWIKEFLIKNKNE